MKKYKSFIKSITIVLLVQATIYFLIKVFQSNFHLLNTFIHFPTIKGFVYFYDIWYPFIILNAFLLFKDNKDNYKEFIFSLILGAFLAHITFLIYPTMINRPDITVNNLTDFVLYITYKTDTPAVNCLPSVHCLFCFISIYFISKSRIKYKIPIIITHILIVMATLFIKQHVIEDAILSFIYTIIVLLIVYIFKDKLKKILDFLF